MSSMGKAEIETSISELKAEKKELQTKINNWEKKEPSMDNVNYGLWITQLGKYSDEMIGLNNRLKGLEDTLGKLTIELPKQPPSNDNKEFELPDKHTYKILRLFYTPYEFRGARECMKDVLFNYGVHGGMIGRSDDESQVWIEIVFDSFDKGLIKKVLDMFYNNYSVPKHSLQLLDLVESNQDDRTLLQLYYNHKFVMFFSEKESTDRKDKSPKLLAEPGELSIMSQHTRFEVRDYTE